jgi:hypothetical protein
MPMARRRVRLELTRTVADAVNLLRIASAARGRLEHFAQALTGAVPRARWRLRCFTIAS